ncbi:HEAT repeat domain-containing protein [Myxococcota bacterium]|nr:HEAT repeat domain-containing protein [Myxococcota bacterium]
MKFLTSLLAVLLVGPLALAAPPKKDDATLHTVLYDYAKWSRGDQPRYVLIPKPIALKEEDFEGRLKATLSALKSAKKSTYGATKVAFKPDSAQTGKVWVYLDEQKRQYHPIVMAEVVYSFTEVGASRVIFPKVAEQGWTRQDVSFPAFQLALDAWEGLPPDGLEGVLLRLPGGGLMTAEGLRAGLKAGEPKLIDALWAILDQGQERSAIAVIAAAKHLKRPELSDKLLPVLRSANPALRQAALEGLDGLDEAKTNAAIRQIMDKDSEAGLRDKAAVLLSRSKDPTFAVAAQFHALRSEDPKTVAEAAKALGESKEKEAKDHLLERLSHPNAEVRAAVIASLIKRKEDAPLLQALRGGDQSAEVKVDIARAFVAGKDAKARRLALTYLVVRGPVADAVAAAEALADEKGRDVLDALGEGLKHPKAEARIAAAEALVRRGDKGGLSALGEADVDNPESGAQIEDALRRLYAKQNLNFVLKSARKEQGVLQRAAVATLGEMVLDQKSGRAKKDTLKALETLAQAKQAEIRAAAARSFESVGDESVREQVYELAKDKEIIVQRAVARALGKLKGDKSVALLLSYIKTQDTQLLANSLRALGDLQDLKGLQPIIDRIGHKEVEVRRAATSALVKMGEVVEKKKPLLALFSERLFESDVEVRLRAIDGLLITQDAKSVQLIAALLQDPSVVIRKAALAGLGKTGEALALDDINAALEDEDVSVRAAAIEAMRVLGKRDGASRLEAYLKKEKDKALRAQAQAARDHLKKQKG